MNLGLSNKIVLVTGSSRGIGLVIPKGFLREGAKVVLSSRNQKELDLIVELSIKDVALDVPLKLKIIPLTENLIQIRSDLNFSRTSYQVGTGIWSSTAILKDKAAIRTNLFLFKN